MFWVEVKEVLSNGDLIVRNLVEKGKRKIRKVEERIESNLVYPAVRGSDIRRWGATPEVFVIIAQDPTKKAGYPESIMREKWQRTFNYLSLFKKELLDRAAYKKCHAESGHSLYSQYNIADYTFAHYKVVWKRMANDVIAAVISQTKADFGWKTIIPTDTTSLFATKVENEAHYLCAIVNSRAVRKFIKSYSSAGRGFGTPSVMEHVGIPKFNTGNPLHRKLSKLSKSLHKLRSDKKEEDIGTLEEEVDKTVWKLFGRKGKDRREK